MEQDHSRIPFKVAIVGELYTVMDPHINRGVEQKLGELGVEVTRYLLVLHSYLEESSEE